MISTTLFENNILGKIQPKKFTKIIKNDEYTYPIAIK